MHVLVTQNVFENNSRKKRISKKNMVRTERERERDRDTETEREREREREGGEGRDKRAFGKMTSELLFFTSESVSKEGKGREKKRKEERRKATSIQHSFEILCSPFLFNALPVPLPRQVIPSS